MILEETTTIIELKEKGNYIIIVKIPDTINLEEMVQPMEMFTKELHREFPDAHFLVVPTNFDMSVFEVGSSTRVG